MNRIRAVCIYVLKLRNFLEMQHGIKARLRRVVTVPAADGCVPQNLFIMRYFDRW